MTIISLLLLMTLSLAALFEVSARLLQFGGALGAYFGGSARFDDGRPVARPDAAFVSVHIPTHDEPPELVIANLRALARSCFAAFEVIVLDNNTPDPATWVPVKTACDALGARFRFVHMEGLEGAKAGALNVALAIADPRTTHVAIVDADYQVHPEFLRDGLEALLRTDADYVQFPQAYRGVAISARGVEHELGDYFACFGGGAGRPGSMLPTGTLSLFAADALVAIGGWPTGTITEDAEIGIRLQRAGYRGLWLSQERGQGLLPVDFSGLAVQRARWAAGNLQVLKSLCRRRWPGLTLGEFVSLTVQLTAWLSLYLPLAGALALAALVPTLPHAREMAGLAAAAILLSSALTAARMMLTSRRRRLGWRTRLGAVAAKVALTWTSATAWLPALSPRSLVFKRTGKVVGPSRGGGLGGLAALSGGFLIAGALYALRGQVLEAAACALLGSAWVCARAVDKGLRDAARANPELRAEQA